MYLMAKTKNKVTITKRTLRKIHKSINRSSFPSTWQQIFLKSKITNNSNNAQRYPIAYPVMATLGLA